MSEIRSMLADIISRYPDKQLEYVRGRPVEPIRKSMLAEIDRITFELFQVAALVPRGERVADVGGGLCPFAAGLAKLGYQTVLVDDFRDHWHGDAGVVLDDLAAAGVEVMSCDILSDSFKLPAASLGAVTCFDCLEHMHNSPKLALHKLLDALKPGGLFIVGVPNCVNLRKRLTVPLGIGKWSAMTEWYEDATFRGHVREPDVDDLLYIARDLGLQNIRVLGRNWLGYRSRFRWVRTLTPVLDLALQLAPSLCSNIYLIGTRATNQEAL